MNADNQSLHRLFTDLLGIQPDPEGKPSPLENLTDVLEVVAVLAGIKPAHLNGQGLRSERILSAVDRIALQHGLLTVRTKSIKRHEIRKPAYEPEIYEWQREQDEAERKTSPDVLWVFKQQGLEVLIHKTIEGAIDVSEVLGYPKCCVYHDYETGIRLREGLVSGLKRTYGAKTVSEVVELLKKDAKTIIEDINPGEEMKQSNILFPYVQFTACPECLRSTKSPAAVVNAGMCDLAFKLSDSFGHDIWRASYQLFCPDRLKNLGRNDPCPCGRGKKYKKCCQIEV